MRTLSHHLRVARASLLLLATLVPNLLGAQSKGLEPLKYTIRIPEPSTKTFNVEIK